MLSLFNILFSFKRIYIIILTSTTMQIWACLSQSSATCHKDFASCFLGPKQSIASTLWCNSRASSPWTQCGNLLSLCFFYLFIFFNIKGRMLHDLQEVVVLDWKYSIIFLYQGIPPCNYLVCEGQGDYTHLGEQIGT